MSILNDDRRVSDDIWEYSEWLNEVKREYRREQWEQDNGDLILESEDEEDA